MFFLKGMGLSLGRLPLQLVLSLTSNCGSQQTPLMFLSVCFIGPFLSTGVILSPTVTLGDFSYLLSLFSSACEDASEHACPQWQQLFMMKS